MIVKIIKVDEGGHFEKDHPDAQLVMIDPKTIVINRNGIVEQYNVDDTEHGIAISIVIG